MRSLGRGAYRLGILIAIAAAALIGLLFLGPLPQDPTYHLFADTREIGGLQNFSNIVSSIPFLLVGLYGLWRRPLLVNPQARAPYTALCLGALCISLGSVYYHSIPSSPALFWDRLPMTVAFMAFFSLLLEERVIPKARSWTLWPLLAAGIGAASYWYWTESRGIGDLRAYALVQFLPMALIPAILLLFPGKYLNSLLLWSALGLYFLAKVFEHLDRQVLESSGILSGHTVKHLLASMAMLCIILAVPSRSGPGNLHKPTSGESAAF